jgi:hypothetical protein
MVYDLIYVFTGLGAQKIGAHNNDAEQGITQVLV